MDTLSSRRNKTSMTTTTNVTPQSHLLIGRSDLGFGFSGSHPPQPYTSPIAPPLPTYSSLPSPQFSHYHNSNPPLLPTRSHPRPMPPHRKFLGMASEYQKQPKSVNARKNRNKRSLQAQEKASAGVDDRRELVESPPPSSLPLPRFLIKRKVAVAPELSAESMDFHR